MTEAGPVSKEKAAPRWRRWLVEGLLVLLALAAFQLWQLRDAARGPAPAIVGQQIDGAHFSLDEWRAAHPGEALLIYFWAEWCPICKTTAGSVDRITADQPVLSVAVQSGDSAAVAAWLRQKGHAWATLNDPQGALLRQFGLPGLPAFVVIDPAGDIRFVAMGYTSEIGLRLRLWWAGRGAG